MKQRSLQSAVSVESFASEQARADALFNSIGEAAIATNEQGRIIKVNDAALEMLGYEAAELLEKSYLTVMQAYDMNGEPFDPLSRPIMRSLIEGKSVTENLQYGRKNGSHLPVSATVSPIMLEGKPIGTIQVFRDITREQQIDRAKTEFVSLASHQLRTPLTAIRWYLELLLKGQMGRLTEEQAKSLEEVHNTSLHMIELVNALLSVARIEVGTLAVTPEPSDIEQLAREVVAELRPQIIEKNLHFEEQYDPAIPSLSLDPDLTRIIFQNLLSNAVKYTPVGGNIDLSIERKKRSIYIEVADNGYGVPKHQQRHLFTKLFRADNVRQQDTDGTGLGLYIVRSIVEGSRGRVWFKSEENKGSTFYVRLPIKGMKTSVVSGEGA